jgi:hypothetical protein
VYQLIKFLSVQQLVIRQLPLFIMSFVIAALFYKFGSFAIECIAFLATWAVTDFLFGLFAKDESKVSGASVSADSPQ